jgi:hypothetical protein
VRSTESHKKSIWQKAKELTIAINKLFANSKDYGFKAKGLSLFANSRLAFLSQWIYAVMKAHE